MEKKIGRPKKAELVKVETLRKIGLDDRTSEVGEIVYITKEAAKVLQEAGAIKVVL